MHWADFDAAAKQNSCRFFQARQTIEKVEDVNERLADYALDLDYLTAGIVVTGFLQVLILLRADKTARMGLRIAAKQSALTRRQMLIAGQQASIQAAQKEISDRSTGHFQASERAYIQMSHVDELVIKGTPTQLRITMEIKNWGKTPGTVTDQMLAFQVLGRAVELDAVPQHDLPHPRMVNAFLVPTGKYNWDTVLEHDYQGAMKAINGGALQLYLIGFVDYQDQFGGRYRSGYARVYLPDRNGTGNNLGYVNLPGYNFDRARVFGEGIDWGDA